MTDVPQLPTERAESRTMMLLSNGLAILGFVLLFVIIVWGLFHLLSLSPLRFGSGPTVSITAPKTAVSGEPLTMSWKYSGKETGTYSFLYQCSDTLSLGTETAGGLSRIPCGSAINVGSSTNATIVPLLSGPSPETAKISVVFSAPAGARTEGSAAIAVAPAVATSSGKPAGAAKPAAPAKKPSYAKPSAPSAATKARRATDLVPHASSGLADLSVKLIAVGVVDPSSGALLPRQPRSPDEIVGVEFDIANVGGSSTGAWYFAASLPTGPSPYLYVSPRQISLRPGEHIVNILRFAPNMPGAAATIVVDPEGAVHDADRANNTLTRQI